MTYKIAAKFVQKYLAEKPKTFETLRAELWLMRAHPSLTYLHWVEAGSVPWSEELTDIVTDLISAGIIEADRELLRKTK